MLQFDKLKLVAPLASTTNHDLSRFIVNSKQDTILSYKYQQKSPFSLIIEHDFTKGESVLEFTSKVLKEDYPKMISLETIERCLTNINTLGLCKIDVEMFMQQSRVVKCDITRDVVWTDFTSLHNVLSINVSNRSKWEITKYSNHGVVIDSKLKTKRLKNRLSIYRKDVELKKKRNAQFLNSLNDPISLISHFEHVVRFELNVDKEEPIRTLLQIETNDLMSVLHSDANPIAEVFKKAIKTEPSLIPMHMKLKDLEKWALIQYCQNNDIELETLVRRTISKNTSVKQTMELYRKLQNINLSNGIQPIDIYNLIM